jgi:hypothetical protein
MRRYIIYCCLLRNKVAALTACTGVLSRWVKLVEKTFRENIQYYVYTAAVRRVPSSFPPAYFPSI